jgi:hypothetical protein
MARPRCRNGRRPVSSRRTSTGHRKAAQSDWAVSIGHSSLCLSLGEHTAPYTVALAPQGALQAPVRMVREYRTGAMVRGGARPVRAWCEVVRVVKNYRWCEDSAIVPFVTLIRCEPEGFLASKTIQ